MFKFEVYYDIFKNENHPNGYIIIHKVIENRNDEEFIIEPTQSDDPEKYIKNIHDRSLFTLTSNDPDLDSQTITAIFRTAECIITAKENNEVVDREKVIQARGRMTGRRHGVAIK